MWKSHWIDRLASDRRPGLAALVLAASCISCTEPTAPAPLAQRLVDVFEPGMLAGHAAGDGRRQEPTRWRFDGNAPAPLPAISPATWGWQPVAGIRDLRREDGRLTGTTTSEMPILRRVVESVRAEDDVLHEVRVRLRAAAGRDLYVNFLADEQWSSERLEALQFFWHARTPLIAGEQYRTYSLTRFTRTIRASQIRQILLRPCNAAGSRFEIESLRLIFRREYLAGIPSGIGWHGFGEGDFSGVYRETVAARTPETITWSLTLPPRPRLEVALGTVDLQPVTFSISLLPGDGEAVLLAQRTMTTPERWETVAVDLDRFAGHQVTLQLALTAAVDGVLGLWGSPVVRSRVALSAPAGAPPQGVILILADTLRYDRLDVYGHQRPTAPALGRMAREGTLFRDAVAQGSWTGVSVPSMVTSTYPSTNTVRDHFERLPSSATTLAEAYREAGHATLGFSSVNFTGKLTNLHQGYEVLHEATTPGVSKTARGYVDRLLDWLDRHRQERFFVFLHVFDPHRPYEPPSPWSTWWGDPAWQDEHRRHELEVRAAIADPLARLVCFATPDDVRAAGLDPDTFRHRELDWYDGSIRGMDEELGRLFERLRELGLDTRTLVAFASDHGEEFHDHGLLGHGHTLYDELTRVPLVLWYPGVVPEGTVVEDTVQLIDLMPTLLELSGLPLPDEIQGRSLVPLLAADGGTWRPRPAISEKPATEHPASFPPQHVECTSLIFEGWKLIRCQDRNGTVRYQLFDHGEDPHDQHDLARGHPEVVERLAKNLEAWQQAAVAQRLESGEEMMEEMSEEELERLRALGYI